MINDQADLPVELQTRGVALVRSVLSDTQLSFLWSLMRPETAAGAVRHRSGEAYGARGLLANRPALKLGLAKLMLDDLAGRALGRPAFPIDALFFDKHSEANWAVPGHQDVVVPIPLDADRSTVKHARSRENLTYGEPDEQVLQELVAIRVHFDDSDSENGALAVVPGSHLRGRLPEVEIRGVALEAYVPCTSRSGDVLLFKPLLLHRSARSNGLHHRRVLHVLYAPVNGWHDRSSGQAA